MQETPGPGRAAPAPSEEAQALALELSHDLMSPYCPGMTLSTCPSSQARKLEAEILAKAEAGMSRGEIEAELVGRFPEIQGYIGRPEVIYGTALAAIVALAAIAWSARRWLRHGRTRRGATAGPEGIAVDPQRLQGVSQREIDALEDALDEVDEF